ncbi:3421_t:CDS:2, partial [Gigaspora rosea]
NPKNIFVHKGNLKLNEFDAFQYRNKFLNKFKLIQYTDPNYLENPKTYKLNKSSDIYKISSGIEKSESSYDLNLLSSIIHGKRESAILELLKIMKIYTECWKYDPNLHPTIQH